MATPTPFSFLGSLQLPADQTLPPSPIPFNASGNFQAKEEGTPLNLVGAGSFTVPFGTIGSPGAKGLFLRYDAQVGGAPVLLTFNGGNQPIELTPGGFLAYCSPTPAAGITSLSIAYTASCQIRVWALGG